MALNGNGRKQGQNGIQILERKALVQEMIEKGLDPIEIASLKVGNYKTILKDVKEMTAQWIESEPEWYDRTRVARMMAGAQYKQQLRRLFAYLEDPDGKLQQKDVYFVEKLISECIAKIFEVTTSFDPTHYRKMVIEERKSITLIANEEGHEDSRTSD